ncbi:MAG: hypothetical protein SFX18_14795 [Pirellulales bacterium]|nr:hypothetical protein [Pirellulales bacterium]
MRFTELVILLPCHSLEDFPLYHTGDDASGLLAAWSALWHPVLLAQAQKLPTWARCDDPPQDTTGKLLLLPGTFGCDLPSDYAAQVAEQGGVLIIGGPDRTEILNQIFKYNLATGQDREEATIPPEQFALVDDFFALALGYLWTELLTRRMRYMSLVEEARFGELASLAARVSALGDADQTRTHLQGAFDLLLQARSHFYPVDTYWLNILLVNPQFAGASLRRELATERPQNILLSAKSLAEIAAAEPETLELIRAGLAAERLTVIGGDNDGAEWPIHNAEAILADLRAGGMVWKKLLDQEPRHFGRQRHGLTPILPGILQSLGYQSAWHITFDEGRFPESQKTKTSWEGWGTKGIEAIGRLPLHAGESAALLNLPEKLGATMDHDHVAVMVFVHWPGHGSPFFHDLLRIHDYAPVLGRFCTFEQFFNDSVGTGDYSYFQADQYRAPYLTQTSAPYATNPILARQSAFQQRLANQQQMILRGLAGALCQRDCRTITGEQILPLLATGLGGTNCAVDNQQQLQNPVPLGVLLVNPTSASARVRLVWPAAWGDLPLINGMVKAAIPLAANDPTSMSPGQTSSISGELIVEIPALGFSWVGKANSKTPGGQKSAKSVLGSLFPGRTTKLASPIATQWQLVNELVEVTISPQTGGIVGVRDLKHRGNRLSQQLAWRLPDSTNGQSWEDEPTYATMRATQLEIQHNTGVLGQIVSRGDLVDAGGEVYARFEQQTSLAAGSRVVELTIKVWPLKPLQPDPWQSYLACRWAWPHETQELWRSVHEAAQLTTAKRIEAADFVEIRDEKVRTTILTGGLAFHLRTEYRKFDTLLAVSREEPPANQQPWVWRLGIGLDLPNCAAVARQFALGAICHQLNSSATNDVPVSLNSRVLPGSGWPSVNCDWPGDRPTTGWLVHVDVRDVLVTAIESLLQEDRVCGLRLRLQETAGLAGPVHVQLFHPISSAQRIQFSGEAQEILTIENNRVRVDLEAYDWAEIALWW